MWQQNISEATENITKTATQAATNVGTIGNNFGLAFLDVVKHVAGTVSMVAIHFYEVLVRQQLLIGIQKLVLGILLLIGSIILIKLCKRVWKREGWDEIDKSVITIAIGLVLYVSVTSGFALVVDSLPRIFNPEYYAAQEAIQMLKDIKSSR